MGRRSSQQLSPRSRARRIADGKRRFEQMRKIRAARAAEWTSAAIDIPSGSNVDDDVEEESDDVLSLESDAAEAAADAAARVLAAATGAPQVRASELEVDLAQLHEMEVLVPVQTGALGSASELPSTAGSLCALRPRSISRLSTWTFAQALLAAPRSPAG